jgi:hypothetical protein
MDLTRTNPLSDLRYYIKRKTITHIGYPVLFGKPNKGNMRGWTAIRKVQENK